MFPGAVAKFRPAVGANGQLSRSWRPQALSCSRPLVGQRYLQKRNGIHFLAQRRHRCKMPVRAVEAGGGVEEDEEGTPGAAGSATDRSVMLREKEGAPITVLEPAKYYSMKTDEYEFLIAMDSEGKLDLQSCFIVDDYTGISSRASVVDGVPDGFRHYMEVPWTEEDTGDLIMGKKGSVKTLRRYYIEALDRDAIELSLDKIYIFDVESRSIGKTEVIKGDGWDDEDAYIRFLEDGSVVMQSSETTPTPEEIVRKNWEQFVREGGLTKGIPPEQMVEEAEEIEFDLDVPEVDMS